MYGILFIIQKKKRKKRKKLAKSQKEKHNCDHKQRKRHF